MPPQPLAKGLKTPLAVFFKLCLTVERAFVKAIVRFWPLNCPILGASRKLASLSATTWLRSPTTTSVVQW